MFISTAGQKQKSQQRYWTLSTGKLPVYRSGLKGSLPKKMPTLAIAKKADYSCGKTHRHRDIDFCRHPPPSVTFGRKMKSTEF